MAACADIKFGLIFKKIWPILDDLVHFIKLIFFLNSTNKSGKKNGKFPSIKSSVLKLNMSMEFKKLRNKILKHLKTFDVTFNHYYRLYFR